MRLLQSLLVPLTFASLAAAIPAEQEATLKDGAKPPKKKSVDLTEEAKDTVFNGQTVPPIPMLDGEELEQQISHGYWLVESFSPYCGHCKHLAPKWQTLYEFYYTSDPLPASNDDPGHPLNSFSKYYDFKWGKLDCVANADACTEMSIRMFPTVLLYKDGKHLKNMTGDQPLDDLMGFIEDALEKIKPGSRPEGGVVLPKVGAKGSGLIEGFDDEESGTGVMVPKKDPKSAAMSAASSKHDPAAHGSKEASKHPTHITSDTPAPLKSFAQLLPSPYSSSVSLSPPNPNGLSLPFSPDNFTKTVTESLDPWLLKFYAPWCHHCQALAPSWQQLAKDMQGKLNIGEVNCEEHRKICKENHVKYYPTIQLNRGPESLEYSGLRGVQDMITYASTAAESLHNGVPEVDLDGFEGLEMRKEVIFIYFYDHATTSEDFMALERLPLHVLGKATLVKSSDSALVSRFKVVTFPRLIVAKEGVSEQYPKLMPKEMRDVPALTKWMKNNWLPLVPEVDSNNARDVMSSNFAVLALLDHARPEAWNDAVRELKAAAIEWGARSQSQFESERQGLRDQKAARVEEAENSGDEKKVRDAKLKKVEADKLKKKGVTFGAVDTGFWERWVRGTFDARRGTERVVIYDYERRRYWDTTKTGKPISASRASILETLPLITSKPPQMRSKIVGSSLTYWPFLVGYVSKRHPYWVGGLTLPVVCIVLWRRLRRRRERRRGGGEKEGLLGMTTLGNGKAD